MIQWCSYCIVLLGDKCSGPTFPIKTPQFLSAQFWHRSVVPLLSHLSTTRLFVWFLSFPTQWLQKFKRRVQSRCGSWWNLRFLLICNYLSDGDVIRSTIACCLLPAGTAVQLENHLHISPLKDLFIILDLFREDDSDQIKFTVVPHIHDQVLRLFWISHIVNSDDVIYCQSRLYVSSRSPSLNWLVFAETGF